MRKLLAFGSVILIALVIAIISLNETKVEEDTQELYAHGPDAHDWSHPLSGKTMILKNVYNGSGNRYNDRRYLGFLKGTKAMRVVYGWRAAMPIRFHGTPGRPFVYTMYNLYPKEARWISFASWG